MTHHPAEVHNHNQLEHCKGHYLSIEISDRTLTASLCFFSGKASALYIIIMLRRSLFFDARYRDGDSPLKHDCITKESVLNLFANLNCLFTDSGVY